MRVFRFLPQVDCAFLRAKFPLPPDPAYNTRPRNKREIAANGDLAEQWEREADAVRRREDKFLCQCLRYEVCMMDAAKRALDPRRCTNPAPVGRKAARRRVQQFFSLIKQ